MNPWKTLSRQVILEHSKFLTVENHSVELPNGQVIEDWPWVVTPDFVNVLAVTRQGEFLIFRQTKYGVEGTSLAPVGGYIEPGEDSLSAAKRELLEESGYQAQKWISLGQYRVDSNRGAGSAHFYLALEADQVQEIHSDDLEEQQLLLLNMAEIEAALLSFQFKVLPWIAIVAMALQYYRGNERQIGQ
jgi:ADP-ribose pyrophosphatase